jgi:hypothetical protein
MKPQNAFRVRDLCYENKVLTEGVIERCGHTLATSSTYKNKKKYSYQLAPGHVFIKILDNIYRFVFLFKTRFGDWILSSASDKCLLSWAQTI